MKAYVFGIGILLMLSFALAGISHPIAGLLRRFDLRFTGLAAFAIGGVALLALIVALAWSVPPRG
jgi:hypothetical protein